ncbi:MAG: ABC transporter permease [Candidatus Firestonebacteria bacterium]
MDLTFTVKLALENLSLHKLRSLLTMLGIIFGVAALISMLSIAAGAEKKTLEQIKTLGIENIILKSIKPLGIKKTTNRDVENIVYGIKRKDMNSIKEVFSKVKMVVPIKELNQQIYSNFQKKDIKVIATTMDYLEATKSKIEKGRFFNNIDTTQNKRVCVLGTKAKQQLFSYRVCLGEYIKISKIWFKVIGIFENTADTKSATGNDSNNYIYIPYSTAIVNFGDRYTKQESGVSESSTIEIDQLYITMQSSDYIEAAADRLKSYMQKIHKKTDYEIVIPLDLLRQKEATQRTFSIVMATIAGISLLVGGIGIMNIMLANIYERTKEIGTRRALGAKKTDVLIQFLTEAILLTNVGGIIGIFLGVGIAYLVVFYAKWPVIIQPYSIILSFLISGIIGIVFGTYPAYKAANLNPIDALRSE